MDSFTLRATLTSPVIMRGHCTLDAVLMAVLNKGDVSELIKCDAGLYYASSANLLGKISTDPVSFVMSMMPTTRGHLWAEVITPDRAGKISINTKKAKMAGAKVSDYQSHYCEAIEWYATGDGERVLEVMRNVLAVGKKRAYGYGEVGEWSVTFDDNLDGLVGVMGEPTRPIPVERWDGDKDFVIVDAAWKPAYWEVGNRAACYAPEVA